MQKASSLVALTLSFFWALNAQSQSTTAFTYQGRLNLNTNAATGTYDLRFTVYDAATGGAAVTTPITNRPTAVSAGLFTALLDFGAAAFPGANRWLDIAIRTNGSTAAYTTLSPRQRITATPFALTAANLAGTFGGDVTGTQGATTVGRLRGVNIAAVAPSLNQVLRYDGSAWSPGSVTSSNSSGTLAATNGGTGQIIYTAGDLLYASTPTTLARRAIGTPGQTLMVSNGFPTWGAANSHDHFGQAWSGIANDGLFVQNASTGFGSSAITGSALGTAALNYGVFGQSASSQGTGVQGFAFAKSGFSSGVYGESISTNGTGVFGLGSAVSGVPVGIYGEADAPQGIGVYGFGAASSGVPVGIFGQVNTTNGYGLYTPNRLFVGAAATVVGTLSAGAVNVVNTNRPAAGLFSPATNILGFSTAGTERIRLASDGKLGLGRTATTNIFEVEGNASKTVAGTWVANSDARIKTRVQNIEHALETIERVRPVSFRYTDAYRGAHPSIEDKSYYNVIAQEFAKVFPEAVKESGETLDGKPILQVDVHPAGMYAIAAIQELHGLMKSKDAELSKLKEQNTALERRLETLEKIVAGLAR